eukprot:gene29677-51706_t
MARYSNQYLTQLFEQRDYRALIDLQAAATGWEGFNAGSL